MKVNTSSCCIGGEPELKKKLEKYDLNKMVDEQIKEMKDAIVENLLNPKPYKGKTENTK